MWKDVIYAISNKGGIDYKGVIFWHINGNK